MKISTDRSSLQMENGDKYSATINLTIDGQTRRVRASIGERFITVYGLAVRIGHGQKVWQGSACLWNGHDTLLQSLDVVGRDRRRGEAYVVGFYSDFGGEAVSRANQAGQAGA